MSITPAYIESLRKRDARAAERLKSIRLENVDRSLASILTMNTIAHTVGAIEAGSQAAVVFGSNWVGLFSAVVTLAILYLSEIIPKTLGAVYWPKLVGFTSSFIRCLIIGLYPLVRISEWLTQFIIGNKTLHGFKRDEFVALADLGEEEGKLEEHESTIIKALFRFRSLKATDIMTPRTVITALPESLPLAQAQEQWSKIAFSRCPLYRDNVDNIIGFALKNEVLSATTDTANTLADIKRDIPVVLDTVRLPALLDIFVEKRLHIALIVDEYGSPQGLVTLEDVLETLLGVQIMDEMDSVENMRLLARQQWERQAEELGIKTSQKQTE